MFTKDCGVLTTHASRGNDKHERERRDIRAYTRSVQVSDFDRFNCDAVDEAGQGEVHNGIGDAIESAISTFYSNILLQLNFIKCRTPLQMSDFLKFI